MHILATDLSNYIPVLVIVILGVVFAAMNLVMSHMIGPRLNGARKGIAYESGMDPIGDSRKRFNIRFYIMAMTFLVFDVEIIFLYPWAVSYTQLEPQSPDAFLFLTRILFFIATSIIAYLYAWRKGVFRWD